MNLSEKEAIRTFVRGQLCDEIDLSTLTIRILKKRYLEHVQGDTLSPEAKHFMKEVVQEEIIKMQDTHNSGSKMETKTKTQKKRKRTSEIFSEEEGGFVPKKSCRSPLLSAEVEEETGSENKKQVVNKTESSEDSTDKEQNGAETERNGGDSPKEVSALKDRGAKRKSSSCGTEMPQSDSDGSDGDDVSKSEKSKKDPPSDDNDHSDGPNQKTSEKKIKDDTDSDSSLLPSLDEEDDGKGKEEVKKKGKQKSNNRGEKGEHKSIVRLKRFISLCGVWRNYKKLLHGYHSVRSQVAVLKKELTDLGLEGKPSVEKCKKLRLKREEAQELAELDIKNIISTNGRPKRRGTSQEQGEPPSATYTRTFHSDDDSDQKNNIKAGRQRTTDWSNLQGIISDDAESD